MFLKLWLRAQLALKPLSSEFLFTRIQLQLFTNTNIYASPSTENTAVTDCATTKLLLVQSWKKKYYTITTATTRLLQLFLLLLLLQLTSSPLIPVYFSSFSLL